VPVTDNASHTLHFEGAWTPEAQKRISAAVAEYEAENTNVRLISDTASWVCVAYDVGSSSLFCAHRPHLPTVLSAPNVGALAASIRAAP
jgi:hypothetical protein